MPRKDERSRREGRKVRVGRKEGRKEGNIRVGSALVVCKGKLVGRFT